MPNEQLELIDVTPEHSTEIVACAKLYKKAQALRIEYLNEEKAQKSALLDLIEKENLTRLDDGTIKFTVDNLTIKVTPRDELVQVKDETESATPDVD